MFSYGKSGLGGEHLFKAGVQWGRLYYGSDYSVQGDHYAELQQRRADVGRASSTRRVHPQNVATVTGFFIQDSWSMNRLTLNLGGR